jgi:hypothetical protein
LGLAEENKKAHEEQGMKISDKRETLHHLKKFLCNLILSKAAAPLSASATPQSGDHIIVPNRFRNNRGPAGMSEVNPQREDVMLQD